MDCGTGLAKRARLNPYGEALRRHMFARPRAPGPAAEGRIGEKSSSQFGVARKPLKSPDSRKKKAWISLPLALNFLPNDLDFPSPSFANPSTSFVTSRLSRETTPLPLAFSSSAWPARRPFSARAAPAVLRCVNAVAATARDGNDSVDCRNGKSRRARRESLYSEL